MLWLTPQHWWHHPKAANPTSLFPVTNLTTHDSYFKLTIEILPGWISGQDLAPVKKKCPSPPAPQPGHQQLPTLGTLLPSSSPSLFPLFSSYTQNKNLLCMKVVTGIPPLEFGFALCWPSPNSWSSPT